MEVRTYTNALIIHKPRYLTFEFLSVATVHWYVGMEVRTDALENLSLLAADDGNQRHLVVHSKKIVECFNSK